MPAPTNLSAATATDLGSWPVHFTQSVTDGGITYTVWFQFTTTADQMLNLLAWGGGGTYIARSTLYAADGTTVLYNLQDTDDLPWQFPVEASTLYYLKVASKNGNVADGTLTITGALPPNGAAVSRDLIVTDDFEPFDAAILDQTDGTLTRFVPMVNGEFGASLPDGSGGFVYALTNDNENPPSGDFELVYYDTSLQETLRPYTFTSSPKALASNESDLFYLADSINVVKAVDRSGSLVNTWTMSASTIITLCPSRDDAILYWAIAGIGQAIRRYDLVNGVDLTDLTAAPSGYAPVHEIRVLANGHILVTWLKQAAPSAAQIIEYQTDGTQVRAYPLTIPSTRFADGPRICLNAEDDSSSFWAWLSGDDADPTFPTYTGRFTKLATGDGSTLTTFDVTEFEQGRGPYGLTADWPTFGNSKSCPLLLLRSALATPPTITTIPPFDCDTGRDQTVTITGTNFGSNPVVTATDPDGNETTPTITSHSTTAIVITLTVPACGAWSFVVNNGQADSAPFAVDTGTTYLMRRQRRFLLPFDQNYRVFLSRLEVLAQTGVGLVNGQGSDPVVMLRLSKDGGFTWGNEIQMSVGKIGAYTTRVFTNRLGVGRQWVAELTISDPVFCAWLDCYVDAEKGTS